MPNLARRKLAKFNFLCDLESASVVIIKLKFPVEVYQANRRQFAINRIRISDDFAVIMGCRGVLISAIFLCVSFDVCCHAQFIDVRQSTPGWTENCINCICEASSGCNETVGCISDGFYCGMFLIGKEYWMDAEFPVIDGDEASYSGAFERCTNDPYCASRAVNRYVQQFSQDCNRDGVIDCDDHLRLHYLGKNHCTREIDNLPYYQTFKRCFTSVSANQNRV